MITDTIAAISTAPGMGAIGILRVSGSGTISTCLPIYILATIKDLI